jgi:4-diphosphocytidyl-2C-methyl-D-erythritol kinase
MVYLKCCSIVDFLLAMVFAVLRFMDYHFGIFKPVLQIYKVYIIPHYITIYNTFITVDAQNPYYDVVQYQVVIHKSKDSKNHGQKKIDNWTNNDLQTLCQKTKDQVTRTPLKLEGEFMCSGSMSSSFYYLRN